MKKTLFLLFLLASISSSHACLNYYYSIDKDGHFHNAEDVKRAFNTNFNAKLVERRLKNLQEKLKTERDYKLLSDYAVLLLQAGKTEIALDILEQLSIKHPNDYQIAANLGTAYELSGNNEKALEYIKRGLELNPDSHGGSEWVHVALLEAKLKLAEDSTYLKNRTVLNLTEAQENDAKVLDQLLIQVRERFPFCKGPNDPIMASLLIDLGDCFANTASLEVAKTCYEIAHHYYGASSTETDPKIEKVKELLRQYSGRSLDQPAMQRDHGEGMHNRMSRLPYQKMLDNNNPDDYEINWSLVQSNADSLLNWAGIERSIPPVEKEEVDTLAVSSETSVQSSKEDDSTPIWIYLTIGVFVLGTVIVILTKRKKG